MTSLCLRHVTLLRHPQPVEDAAVLIQKGKIARLGLADDFDVPRKTLTIDCKGLLLAPGFIDLQCNGGFGHDFTNDPATIWQVAEQLPQFGVTSFLPTVITSPLETVERAREDLRGKGKGESGKVGAMPLGLHVEGPFLNPEKKGAHDASLMRVPDARAVKGWTPKQGVRLVTVAPELPNAKKLIAQLVKQKVVVSAGHSMATFAQAVEAFDQGIRYGTHLFNAMPALHHRAPGLAAALLSDERVTVGIIPDGVHVSPDLLRLVWTLAKGRLNVVTDAMAAMGYGPGVYRLGEREVTVDETSARLPDGTLAGSVVTLDQALRNLRKWTDCSLAEAVQTVTEIPASLLGLTNKGRIASGYDADLVLLNHDLTVAKTIIQGDIAYES